MNPAVPNLSELRDIHLPEPVSWWPLAMGWWVLLALIVVAVLVGVWWYRRYQQQRWRREALAELERLRAGESSLDQVCQLSILLRRVAITCFPRAEVASLAGEQWLSFLDQHMGGREFQSQGKVLLSAPYGVELHEDVTPLFDLSERWLKALPVKAQR